MVQRHHESVEDKDNTNLAYPYPQDIAEEDSFVQLSTSQIFYYEMVESTMNDEMECTLPMITFN
jgi:hypothetical protein